MSSEPGALAKVHFQALKPTGQENSALLFFFFKSFSSSNIALFMMCFEYSKGTTGGLHLFPVWPR